MKYNNEINGLRAIAILLVLGFHGFPNNVPSGFIGVDIFFVISGYLITSIITNQIETNQFSFKSFYVARICRIFPALLLVLFSSSLIGWFVLKGVEYELMSKHILAASTFSSNLVYWTESGYFDKAAHSKPLLHLWSLGVEEQFYLALPLLMVLNTKILTGSCKLLAILFFISLTLNVYQVEAGTIAGFYSPLSRAWELLAGSLLSFIALNYKKLREQVSYLPFTSLDKIASKADIFFLLGCGLICSSLFTIKDGDHFPGVSAIPVVLGTVLIISMTKRSILSKLILGNPTMVWIGLISYPLYLWHWVILSLPVIIFGRKLHDWESLIAIIISFILAWLTFVFIEKPVKAKSPIKKNKMAFWLSAALALIGIFGAFSFFNKGFPSRDVEIIIPVLDGDIGHDNYHGDLVTNFFPCSDELIRKSSPGWGGNLRCRQSKKSPKIDVVIIGDSHAEHLFPGVASITEKNVAYYIKNALPSVNKKAFDSIFERVASDSEIEIVILAAHWPFRNREVDKLSNLKSDVSQTISYLVAHNKKVFLIGDNPTFSIDPEKCAFKRLFRPNILCSMTDRVHRDKIKSFTKHFIEIAERHKSVQFVPLTPYFCHSEKCFISNGNKILYRDRNHLNIEGSKYLAQKIERILMLE